MVALLKIPNRFRAAAPVERRIFPRREVHAAVQGHRLDHSIAAHRQPHVQLELRDLSVGGLSALTVAPLLAGERVAVTFPATGLHAAWEAVGRVLRCQPSCLGYRVAMEFDPLPAA